MTYIVNTARCAPAVAGKTSRLTFGAWLKQGLATRRERIALGRLDAHLLNDVGLNKPQAHQEVERPAWDVPDRWRL